MGNKVEHVSDVKIVVLRGTEQRCSSRPNEEEKDVQIGKEMPNNNARAQRVSD